MRRFKGVKGTLLSLSLIITFAFLINANLAGAQTFDTMFLLAGQNATSVTSSTQPASFHTVWVTSIGNSTLSAQIGVAGPSGASGLAWVMILGTGAANWGDIAFGPAVNANIKANIAVGKELSFAIAMGGVILSSPVDVDNPAKYNIKVSQ